MARPRRLDQLTENPELKCDERIVHIDEVRRAWAAIPDSRTIGEMTALYASLSDPTRLRMVAALAEQELCVCDLAATVGQSESAVSHHLRLMRELGLVRTRRDGRLVYYALDDSHVSTLYAQALEHIEHRTVGSK